MLDSEIMRSMSFRQWTLLFLSAALQIVCFPVAGPAPLWRSLLGWICLAPFLLAILGPNRNRISARPAQAALLGYVCGVLWYAGNCYWIYQTMYLYGGIPKPASLGILILFSLYLGLYHALFAWLISLIRWTYRVDFALALSPFVWVAVELARDRITGFPWDLLGYTQVDNLVLTRLAPCTGVMGLSLLVAAVSALWAAPLLLKAGRTTSLALGAAAALTVVGILTSYLAAPQLLPTSATATLIQENLKVGAENTGPTETKEDMLVAFSRLSLRALVTAPPDDLPRGPAGVLPVSLIVWPEAPTMFLDADPVFRATLGTLAGRMNVAAIVDAISVGARNPEGHYDEYNSASFFLPDGSYAGRYSKMHLVPFGEYTPYKSLFFFAGHLLDNLPFIPGKERRLLEANGRHYGVFICYESIFGDEIRQFVSGGAQVLVNISDDGWYGDTSAPWEHLSMVRMRAIENDRWVLRATNTGLTGAIDPRGVIRAQLPRHIRSSLEVGFNYRDGKTFYTRHGDWLGWLCAGIAAGALGIGLVRSARIQLRAVERVS